MGCRPLLRGPLVRPAHPLRHSREHGFVVGSGVCNIATDYLGHCRNTPPVSSGSSGAELAVVHLSDKPLTPSPRWTSPASKSHYPVDRSDTAFGQQWSDTESSFS